MKHYKVLISEKICDEAIQYLLSHGIEIKYGEGTDEKSLIKDIDDCDAVIVRLIAISKKVIDAAPKLRIIAKHGVGYDSIDTEYANQKGIVVINTPGANSQSVAEHTVGLILACAHQIVNGHTLYRDGFFASKDSLRVEEISGKTIGLIGCGRIAKKVANILNGGFAMNVLGYDPFVDSSQKQKNINYVDSLDYLLAQSDFVSLHIPLTNETRHMVNSVFLKKMKKSAFIINTSRGELIDNDALLNGINEHFIAGAGLDVTYPEPLDSKLLFDNSNIIITPHLGASSKESMLRMGLETAKNIVSYFKLD